MLVNQQNSHILPRTREAIERLLDSRRLRLGVDDKEILLRAGVCIGRLGGDVLFCPPQKRGGKS